MIHDFHSGVNFVFDINLSHWKKWAAAAPACFLGKNLSLCPTRAGTTVVVAVAAETPRALIWLQGKTIPTKTEPNLSLSFFPF